MNRKKNENNTSIKEDNKKEIEKYIIDVMNLLIYDNFK